MFDNLFFRTEVEKSTAFEGQYLFYFTGGTKETLLKGISIKLAKIIY